MAPAAISAEISCAAEVFLATALLHREQPDREDFTIQEIVNRAAKEKLHGNLRSGINVHASQHCVANRAANPAKHRMLFATGKHSRRLVLPGDEVHPDRNGKIFPEEAEIPAEYLPVLEWAKKRYNSGIAGQTDSARTAEVEVAIPRKHLQSFLDARGIGAGMAKGIDPDDYIRRLREGWE